MKPLFVLLFTFMLALFSICLAGRGWNYPFAGRIGMSAMLLFTSIGHFVFSRGMQMMLPYSVPLKKQLVWITGLLEILAAIGLLLPVWQQTTAICLVVFFILLLPANIYAAIKKVDIQKATHNGPGLAYLWFRVPLQIVFIAWVYWCAYL